MRFKMVTLVATALWFLPVTAQADDTIAPAPRKAKKICRQVMVTGSIVPKNVCLTDTEWTQVEAAIAPVNARGIDKVAGNSQPKGGTP